MEDLRPSLAAYLTVLVLILIFALPLGRTDIPYLRPLIALSFTYVFTIERPRSLPLPSLALMGLIQDVFAGGILGLNVLLLLAMRLGLEAQMRVFHNWSLLRGWAGFVPVALLGGIISWVVAGLYAQSIQPISWILVQSLLTVSAYPLCAWLLIYADRTRAYR